MIRSLRLKPGDNLSITIFSRLMTAKARRRPRFKLYGDRPVLSVCPTTRIVRIGLPLRQLPIT
jgi:hypothetical protein